MAELRFDASDPTVCVLIDLGTRMVWRPAGEPGAWSLVGELAPGAVTVWRSALDGQRDTSWT